LLGLAYGPRCPDTLADLNLYRRARRCWARPRPSLRTRQHRQRPGCGVRRRRGSSAALVVRGLSSISPGFGNTALPGVAPGPCCTQGTRRPPQIPWQRSRAKHLPAVDAGQQVHLVAAQFEGIAGIRPRPSLCNPLARCSQTRRVQLLPGRARPSLREAGRHCRALHRDDVAGFGHGPSCAQMKHVEFVGAVTSVAGVRPRPSLRVASVHARLVRPDEILPELVSGPCCATVACAEPVAQDLRRRSRLSPALVARTTRRPRSIPSRSELPGFAPALVERSTASCCR
jgi:hypothetical protein